MTKQRRSHESRTGRNDSSRRSSDRKEQFSAQSELNRLKKKITSLKEEISLMPEKEERIRDFFERNAKPVFEKETALKYKFLVYLDESYESGEMSVGEKDILLDLFAEESQGVEDFVTTAEQRKHLLELKYKYDELALGMSREELEQEAVEDTMSLFVNRFGMKPNKAMKTAQTEDELLVAIADNIEAQAQKAVAAATGEKPKRAGRKAKDAEPLQLSRRTLIEQLLMVKTMEEMQRVYSNLMDEVYKGKEKDETSIAQKAERLKQLAVAGARRDLAEMMILQIGWIEEAAQEAPEEEKELAAYNEKLRFLLTYLNEELDIIKEAPLSGVEVPYNQLRNFAWKDLPIQMNMLFTRHKKDMKGIEEYVSAVSSVSGLKSFLQRYKQSRGDSFLGADDWDWE